MRAIRALGQNFLISTSTISSIVSYILKYKPDHLVEIGPGNGALTVPLAEITKHLTCIEKDSLLAHQLPGRLSTEAQKKTTVLERDVLTVAPSELVPQPYDVFGSLPFNISKRIISHFLKSTLPYPRNMFVILQEEVARSYSAESPRNTSLAAIARIYSTVSYVFPIPRTHFSPIPKVDAAFIHFSKITPPSEHANMASFYKFLFKNPRKKINNVIKKSFLPQAPLPDVPADISRLLDKRAEELSDEDMKSLYFMYNTVCSYETRSSQK